MSSLSRALTAAALMALGLGVLAPPARAGDIIRFDPFGTSGATTLQVGSFDENVGNAVAVANRPGAGTSTTVVPLTPGTTFNLYYQAQLGNINDANGNNINGAIALGREFTLVAGFTETVLGPPFSSLPTTAAFSLAAAQVAGGTFGSFLEIYADTANSDNLNGTGFNNGTLILSAHVPRTSPTPAISPSPARPRKRSINSG